MADVELQRERRRGVPRWTRRLAHVATRYAHRGGAVLALTVASFGGASGCGDDPGGGAATREVEEPLPAAIAELVEAACDARSDCACDGEPCRPTAEAAWRARLAYARARTLAIDWTCVATLRRLAEGVTCSDSPEPELWLCRNHCSPIHGARDELQTCSGHDDLASDCAPHLVCSQGFCQSPCSILPRAREGEACNPVGCREGLACSQDQVCVPWDGSTLPCSGETCEGEGDPCFSTRYCAEGTYCPYGSEPRCSPQSEPGAACDAREDRPCAPPAVCTGPVCAVPGLDGEPCPLGLCATGHVCDLGICRRLVDLGESCDTRPCRPPLTCDQRAGHEQRCIGPLAAGEPCNDASACASGACPHGACAAVVPAGAPCDASAACERGSTCGVGGRCRRTADGSARLCTHRGLP